MEEKNNIIAGNAHPTGKMNELKIASPKLIVYSGRTSDEEDEPEDRMDSNPSPSLL